MATIATKPCHWVPTMNGACWVAWVNYQGENQLLRVAYGGDDAEVKKRLVPSARARRRQEALSASQPGQVLALSIELAPLCDFARLMKFDPESSEAEVKWLFRKY